MQLFYDASGKVVETRTMGPDGTLESRDTTEQKPGRTPGFTAPEQTHIGYFPGGKQVERFTHVRFDENENFISEVAEVYDQAGKHTGGHKIAHDPQTGIYRCWDWNGISQAYKSIQCPSGEESGEHPQNLRQITRAQAVQFITKARQKAAAERKSQSVALGRPTPASSASVDLKIGIVLPAHLALGERVSGSVVQDLEPYRDIPGLTLIPVTVVSDSAATAVNPLRRWEVVVTGSKPQPADSPFSFIVPRQKSEITVTLRQPSDPAHAVSRTVPVAQASAERAASQKFEAPVVLVKESVNQVRGRFSGDSGKTFAAVDDVPVAVVAETPSTAFVQLPDDLSDGQHSLIFSDGPILVAIPVVVAEVRFQSVRFEATAGQPKLVIARLYGIEQLPEKGWRPGVFPPSSLERAGKLVPGFNPQEAGDRSEASARGEDEGQENKSTGKADLEEKDSAPAQAREEKERESEREAEEANSGIVLLVISNSTPDVVSFRGSTNQRYVFTLKPDAFSQGEFTYKFLADATRSGPFEMKTTIIPFLGPSSATPFANK